MSIHVGRQHIHLAVQLIGHWPSKKNRHYKLIPVVAARKYFEERI